MEAGVATKLGILFCESLKCRCTEYLLHIFYHCRAKGFVRPSVAAFSAPTSSVPEVAGTRGPEMAGSRGPEMAGAKVTESRGTQVEDVDVQIKVEIGLEDNRPQAQTDAQGDSSLFSASGFSDISMQKIAGTDGSDF
jgi:hypothetical protein